MDNFQLYRTNVFLGGQLKWDIIVDRSSTQLYVADLHLSPLSGNVPYTQKSDEYILKNSHQDNVKEYYKNIKSYFYKDSLNPEYNQCWPIITNENELVDCYSNTYDMGCRRMNSYKLYNRQFEFLCPIWIEQLTDDLRFEISIKNIDSDNVLSKNSLTFKLNGIESHDKFVKYFKNYLNDADLINGTDDLINIDLKNSTASVNGLNASNGLFETKNIDSLVDNLCLIERPLMETDNIIIYSFSNNSLIAKQLFNFNFCFNIEDIMSGSITQLFAGKDMSVTINAYIGDKLLEKKDFYTNYSFIKKETISNNPLLKEDINVLDYLHDYEYIEFIDKNKLSQNICHWSLCDNNDYIFNVYEGFSGMYIEESDGGLKTYFENDHQHGITPNTMLKKSDKSQNTTGWINTTNIKYWNDFYKYFSATDTMKKNGVFIKDTKYINNIKYDKIPDFGEDGIYIIGICVTYEILATLKDLHKSLNLDLYENITEKLLLLKKSNMLIFLSDDENNMAFSKMKDILYASKNDIEKYSDDTKQIIDKVYALMSNKIDADIVLFNSGILWQPADGPSKEASEVTYYKDKSSKDFVLRYSGKIKPTFIDKNSKFENILYYKDYISKDKLNNSKYSKNIKTGYEPLYPSLDYYAINKFKNWSYDKLPKISVSEFDDNVYPYKDHEYTWFTDNAILFLIPEIHFTYINSKDENGEYKTALEIVKEYLKTLFNITDYELIDYILTKYEIINDWDYYSKYNVNDYKYNITLKLK